MGNPWTCGCGAIDCRSCHRENFEHGVCMVDLTCEECGCEWEAADMDELETGLCAECRDKRDIVRHQSGLVTWMAGDQPVMRCPNCGTENEWPYDDGDLYAVCYGGCGQRFAYDLPNTKRIGGTPSDGADGSEAK